MDMRIQGTLKKYAILAIAVLLVGVSVIGIANVVNAQIAQPIAQTGGGFSIAQPVAQGGFVSGPSVVSAPVVARGILPGYTCYQQFPGGPVTCYPGSRVFATGGTIVTSGGIIQPVQQGGYGTQVAAPVAVI
jgi:hypothetical protein